MGRDVSGQLGQKALLDMAAHETRLRVVDHVGRIAALHADVDLGLELVGALQVDLDTGAVDERLVGIDELRDGEVGVGVAHR